MSADHLYEQRFRTLNARRIERTRAFLGPTARAAFDALPGALASEGELVGIYLMGSAGTFGQGADSDLDLWVVPHAGADQSALQRHLDARMAACREQGLDARGFVVDAAALRAGERCLIAGDDCGSTQDRLLLDEFYRTAVVLRGAPPLWWLVHADDEPLYDTLAATLPTHRYLDLGGLPSIPEDEFLGATLWHLHKAIDTPHKSLLKLLLLESYALDRGPPLAVEFKRAVQSNDSDLDRLDPYVLMYRRIERYLARRRDPRRLHLARACLLRRAEAPGATAWQGDWAAAFRNEWGWPAHNPHDADDIGQLLHEHREIARQLEVGHTLLRQWANATPTRFAADRDMRLLEAELAAHTLDWPGKVQRINHSLKRNLTRELLVLRNDISGNAREWVLATRSGAQLVANTSLAHIAAWSSLNGLWPDEPDPLQRAPYDRVVAAVQAASEQLPAREDDYLQPPTTRRDLLLLHEGSAWEADRVTLNSWGEVSTRSLKSLEEISGLWSEIDPALVEVHAPSRRQDGLALRAVLTHRPAASGLPNRLLVERHDSVLICAPDANQALREGFDRPAVLAEIGSRALPTTVEGDGPLLAPLRALLAAAAAGDSGSACAHIALLPGPGRGTAVAERDATADGVLLLDRDGALTYLELPRRPLDHQRDTLRVFLANVARRLRLIAYGWEWERSLVPVPGRTYLPEPVQAQQRDDGLLDVVCVESSYRDVLGSPAAAVAARARVLALRESARAPAGARDYPITVTDVRLAEPARALVRDAFAIKLAVENVLNNAGA